MAAPEQDQRHRLASDEGLAQLDQDKIGVFRDMLLETHVPVIRTCVKTVRETKTCDVIQMRLAGCAPGTVSESILPSISSRIANYDAVCCGEKVIQMVKYPSM